MLNIQMKKPNLLTGDNQRYMVLVEEGKKSLYSAVHTVLPSKSQQIKKYIDLHNCDIIYYHNYLHTYKILKMKVV